jgi:hypothetical protein
VKDERVVNKNRGGGGPLKKLPSTLEEIRSSIASGKCPHCGGALTPETDGNGGLRDRCTKCFRYPSDRAPAATSSTVSAPPAPRRVRSDAMPCSVEGCRGELDQDSGECPCCAKRAAWEKAHRPEKRCVVCTADLSGTRNQKHCDACKPVVARVGVATKKTGQK